MVAKIHSQAIVEFAILDEFIKAFITKLTI